MTLSSIVFVCFFFVEAIVPTLLPLRRTTCVRDVFSEIRPFGLYCTVACPLINCSFFLRSKIFFYWSFFPNFFFCVIIKSKLTPGHNLTIVKFSSRFTRLGLMLLDPQLTAIEHKMNMVLLKFAHGATSNAQHYLKMLCTMITKPPSKSKFYVDFKTIYIFSKITKLTHLLSSHVLRLIR